MDSLRISDADREAAVDLLAEHYATGRLDQGRVRRAQRRGVVGEDPGRPRPHLRRPAAQVARPTGTDTGAAAGGGASSHAGGRCRSYPY